MNSGIKNEQRPTMTLDNCEYFNFQIPGLDPDDHERNNKYQVIGYNLVASFHLLNLILFLFVDIIDYDITHRE